MRWNKNEEELLRLAAKNKIAQEVIGVRLGRSESSVRSKARREGIRLRRAVALPKLDSEGRLQELGGLDIPRHPHWLGGSERPTRKK